MRPQPPAPPAPQLELTGLVTTRLRAAPAVERVPEPVAPSPGIVSSRLRPWLDFEFNPTDAVIDDEKAVVHFEVTVFNSGSAPARDVLIEAALFNAGPDQDQEISAFFANPVANGERVPLIAPLQRMAFRSTAMLNREQVRVFEAGDRKVFVPLIGFNALYRWSSGGGQTSSSYLLGRNTSGEKMAPFILGDGARRFNGLGARPHTVGIRN